MAMIRAAAAAEDGELRKAVMQFAILRTKLFWIPGIEIGRLIELGMAAP